MRSVRLVAAALCALAASPARARLPDPPGLLLVTTAADRGPGSLREAIQRANADPGPNTIRFDAARGPFASPQTVALESDLPPLAGELTLDGYVEGQLWKAVGVTLSGGSRRRVLEVAPGARVVVSSLTVAAGRAATGGGIASRGTLVVKGVTFEGNAATGDGGAVAVLAGELTVLNSTFSANEAGGRGGGVAVVSGRAAVTNCTFAVNRAREGGALHSAGALLLRNTILARSGGGDCASTGRLDPGSTHNIFGAGTGCGTPLTSADPRLGALGAYNGPTRTMPPGGGSPAVNAGDNASAVDETGAPLVWDQRGNGDPRFVAGITDVGAFEVQAFPTLRVNTAADVDARACAGVPGDCSLRGAVVLANAAGKPATVTFDAAALGGQRTLALSRPLPEAAVALTLDGSGTGGVVVRAPAPVLRAVPGGSVQLREVRLEAGR